MRIVPKGLRSFDEHDADFFLELLPGPRDRSGLPDSLRFWKTRIEETDADKTFSVGMIYGPSGCGKSSLVKAGLLPRLAGNINTVYLEATAAQTESRLLHGLRKLAPTSDDAADLKSTLSALRRGEGSVEGDKILIVIDQFEQWLNANKDLEDTPLVRALRQCEGGRIQCIVMVRDDFWMAATRFMHALELRLVEGENSAAVDLFRTKHARRVLGAYGQAFGDLRKTSGKMDKPQREFLRQAVDGLAEEGKVVCVRLALFAEMFKGKPWTPATLKQLGGTEGVGVTFLEETFSASTAPPHHRLHQQAARSVLQALLPESGTDIKGHMKSYDELLAASGYAGRIEDFEDLIRLLDSELRLITPTEQERIAGHRASPTTNDHPPVAPDSSPSTRYYQLAHDYLVAALQSWLNQKQKETRRGRAELRLAERASLWKVKSERRHLPSSWETLNIRLLTDRHHWTPTQRKMIGQATRVHSIRWGILLAMLLVIGIGIRQFLTSTENRNLLSRTRTSVESVRNSRSFAVPGAIEDLQGLPSNMVIQELEKQLETGNASEQLSLRYALAEYGRLDIDSLIEEIPDLPSMEVPNLLVALEHSRADALVALKSDVTQLESDQNWSQMARVAIVMLYLEDSGAAEDMCRLRPDPIRRTIFIDTFPKWHGDVSRLAKTAANIRQDSFRSGICLAIGSVSIDSITRNAKQAWQPLLTHWHENAIESGTHGAAGWTLRKWNLPLPDIASTTAPVDEKNWHINGLGMTMLKIPAGSFMRNTGKTSRKVSFEDRVFQEQVVTLTRPFLLSDREITVGLFQEFIEDPNYAAEEKPTGWTGGDPAHIPTARHPAPEISWYDAVQFCNWLSRREDLQPYYQRTGATEKCLDFKTGKNVEVQRKAWRQIASANGYRLPTEAEWEYACRAGTSTPFFFGDFDLALNNEQAILLNYVALFDQKNPIFPEVGSMPPNGWGLSEMHGTMSEWCDDRYSEYPLIDDIVDPVGPAQYKADFAERIIRSFPFNARTASSMDRSLSQFSAGGSNSTTGFRLARSPGRDQSDNSNPQLNLREPNRPPLEKDRQRVSISRPFLLSDAEVSVGEFRTFIADEAYALRHPEEHVVDWEGESNFQSPTADHPVQYVSWYEAVKFCNWLSRRENLTPAYELTGETERIKNRVDDTVLENPAWRLIADATGYRLPTEAQWELACRAGSTTITSIGNAESATGEFIKPYAVCESIRTDRRRTKMPNGWGLFDLYGNVVEFCNDWFAEFNDSVEVEDPTGPKRKQPEDGRVLRGGFHTTPATEFRSGRTPYSDWLPSIRHSSIGFRVARPLSQ